MLQGLDIFSINKQMKSQKNEFNYFISLTVYYKFIRQLMHAQ